MKLSKFRRLLTLLLRGMGIPQEVIDEITGLYALRRIVPTLAHVSELSEVALLGIGGWVDSKDQSRMAMPFRYSEANMIMQAKRIFEVFQQPRRY